MTVLNAKLYYKIPDGVRPELKRATRNLVVAEAVKHMTTKGVADVELRLGNETLYGLFTLLQSGITFY